MLPHLMGQNWSDLVRFENVTLIGVLHYRVEFSVLVNTFIRNEKPIASVLNCRMLFATK